MNIRNNTPVGKLRVLTIACIIFTFLLAGCTSNQANSRVLTQDLSEPLGDAATAKFEINTGTGNLTIDRLTGGEPLLAGGSLQYLESQGLPFQSLTTLNGLATLTWAATGLQQAGFRFPWEACNGETNWLIHINPSVSYEINAHSDGGNVNLNLAGLSITRLTADTGGGNIDVILPDNTSNLNVTAKTGAGAVTVQVGSGMTGSSSLQASSGAGNVVVHLPTDISARIHLTSGMGKAIVDSRFSKIDDQTYQSADYNSAANRVELTLNSGAGNVTVDTME